MKQNEKTVLNLIKCAINDTDVPIIDEKMGASLLAFSIKQQILPLIFYGVSKQEWFSKSELSQKYGYVLLKTTLIGESQLDAISKIKAKFDEENIHYVFLKGSLLKSIYNKSEYRTMSDIDIIIDYEKEYPIVKKAMKELGFSFSHETDHELHWHNESGIFIELHKRLMPSYNLDFDKYYSDFFQNKLVGDKWEITPEDFFVFMFTHFAKHYRDKGVGIKYVIDFYVYFNYYKTLDKRYIEQELKKLKLNEFYQNIIDVIDVWFNDKEPTEKTDFITTFLFSCYVYGNQENAPLSDGLKISKSNEKVKKTRFIKMMFPSFKGMKIKYPILRKLPILYPFVFIFRCFEVIIKRPYNIKKNFSTLKEYDDEKIKEYQKNLNYVGLDFNFEEDKM